MYEIFHSYSYLKLQMFYILIQNVNRSIFSSLNIYAFFQDIQVKHKITAQSQMSFKLQSNVLSRQFIPDENSFLFSRVYFEMHFSLKTFAQLQTLSAAQVQKDASRLLQIRSSKKLRNEERILTSVFHVYSLIKSQLENNDIILSFIL